MMQCHHREKLRTNRVFLVCNIKPTEALFDFLSKQNILHNEIREYIMVACVTDMSKVRYLLDSTPVSPLIILLLQMSPAVAKMGCNLDFIPLSQPTRSPRSHVLIPLTLSTLPALHTLCPFLQYLESHPLCQIHETKSTTRRKSEKDEKLLCENNVAIWQSKICLSGNYTSHIVGGKAYISLRSSW